MIHGRRGPLKVHPAWVKDPRKYGPFINARAEGITEQPAFRGGMQ
jgi:putative SOS response-associated peptidase YedK